MGDVPKSALRHQRRWERREAADKMPKPFKCPRCEKPFTTQAGADQHVKDKHP